MNVEIWKDPVRWDAFVQDQPMACNYHRWCWKEVIEDTFGHKGYYFAAVKDGVIRAVLPLFDIRTRLFGRSLVSVPFFSYGGILAADSDSRDAVLRAAIELAGETEASRIELRHVELSGDWSERCSKVTMDISLPPTPDEYLRSLSSGMRKKLRYACRNHLSPEWGGIELVDDFYAVFAANMRDLGTPVYPMRWFANQMRSNPQTTRILLLRDGKQAVFAAFLSSFRDGLELPWAASLPHARKKYSQLALYWGLIEWAILSGYRTFDLGRCTPNSGPHQFKRHWGGSERPLRWQYWPADGASAPRLGPESGKFKLAVKIWKHLPLAVTNQLGPRIVRGLP